MAGIIEAELAYNLAQMITDYGTPVTVRRVTTLTGPAPAPNPFVLNGLIANGSFLLGATTVSLKATQLNGRLIAGDAIQFTGDATKYVVGSQIISAANGLASITIAPGLAVAVTNGESANVLFSADVSVSAFVTSYPTRLVNGTSIQNGDLKVRMLASALTYEPKATDKILLGANSYSIVNVKSMDIQGAPYGYSLQARGGVV